MLRTERTLPGTSKTYGPGPTTFTGTTLNISLERFIPLSFEQYLYGKGGNNRGKKVHERTWRNYQAFGP